MKSINLTGIQRNQPQGSTEACDEIINMRFVNGGWEAVGPKKEIGPAPPFVSNIIHKKEPWIDPATGEMQPGPTSIGYTGPQPAGTEDPVVVVPSTSQIDPIWAYNRSKELGHPLFNMSYLVWLLQLSEIDGTDGSNPQSDYDFIVPYIGGYTPTFEEFLFGIGTVEAHSTNYHTAVWYDPMTLLIKQELVRLQTGEIFQEVRFLKNFLLVITDKLIYRFLFKDGTYVQIKLTGIEDQFVTKVMPVATALPLTTAKGTTDFYSKESLDELLGSYYKLLADLSEKELINGGLFYRTTIKLFDGSEILHTLPRFFGSGDLGMSLRTTDVAGNGTKYVSNLSIKLASAVGMSAKAQFTEAVLGQYPQYRDFIQSIVLYASRVQPLFEVSDLTYESLTKYNLLNRGSQETAFYAAPVPITNFLSISTSFKTKIHDSSNWYQVGEAAFSALKVTDDARVFEADFEMDLKGYYNNFATRKQIEVDDFSHHELTGMTSYMYNSRLHIGDTVQSLGLPQSYASFTPPALMPAIGTDSYYGAYTWPVTIQVTLDTTNGKKYVSKQANMVIFDNSIAPSNLALFLPSLIGYPDNRATEIAIYLKPTTAWLLVARQPLEKSLFGNYAYYASKEFSVDVSGSRIDGNFLSYPIAFTLSGLTAENPKTDDNLVYDFNRVQPSQVNNPFVFPVKNSQQVSTSGKILALGTNTESMNQNQFGQYPLYVFTTEGVWGLEIGTGATYITNVVPLSGDVIKNKTAKLDLSFGIAFISTEGIRVISGKQVIDISKPVEGLQDRNLSLNSDLQFILSHPNIVQLLPYLDRIPFREYLDGATMGFNKGFDHSEIVVSNPAYNYSYVYHIESKFWYKLTGKILSFIPNYPDLYAIDPDRGKVINLSEEVTGPVQCMFLTRAYNFEMGDAFKALRRSFIRCHLNIASGKFAGGYVFKTDDLRSWKYVTGNDHGKGNIVDIWMTYSGQSARYFAYLFAAEVMADSMNVTNRITTIDAEFEAKMESKLR